MAGQFKKGIIMEKSMGLKQQVKKGVISIDEALVVAEDYNETIRKWLLRRKKSNVSVRKEKETKKPSKPRKRARHKKKG
jgi:hypothetical protein